MNSTIEFLKLDQENTEYLQSLFSIATAFLVDVPMEEIRRNPILQRHFRYVSELLGVGEEQLDFMLDLVSGSPLRLFKVKNIDINVDHKGKDIIEEADQTRLSLINSLLGYKATKVNQAGSLWLNNYKLIWTDEEIARTFSKTY